MAFSPSCSFNIFPSSYSIPASPPLSNLIFQRNRPSSAGLRTLKLERFCSSSVEIETKGPHTEVARKTKKKRKLKPSFYDQIRDRWSLKLGSPRERLPWQEQESQGQEETGNDQSSSAPNSSEGDGGNPSFDDLASFALGNRSISAPWSHGDKPRKPHFDSTTEIVQNSLNNGGKFAEVHYFSEKSTIPKISEDSVVNHSGSLKEEQRSDYIRDDSVKIGPPLTGFSGEQSTGNGDSVRLPWEKEKFLESVDRGRWRRSTTELAAKTVPETELRRLRNVALRMKERIKVGAAGITQDLVDSIIEKWKEDEVVKLKFEGPPALNMKRTHEALESKTRGLVIWRSGSSVVLYRGMSYKFPCVESYIKDNQANPDIASHSKESKIDFSGNICVTDAIQTKESSSTGTMTYDKDLSRELMDMTDLNNLLDELGPRFRDWSGCEPKPVDADLLPCVVPGYKPPFRLLPYGIRHCLKNKEMTSFRRLARSMPPHFALGRNRQLQGLARAMVKLWERSEIAKIAIKRGVQNTCNERMAEELKRLTGGTLLSRNKDYIVFYRGNDFLSPVVTEALVERKKLAELRQDEEEQARQRALALIISNAKAIKGPLVAGTLAETVAANSRWAKQPSSEDMQKMMKDAALSRHASLVRYLEKKLAQAQEKVKKAEKTLRKVQEFLKPTELPTDLETLTDEERYLFRKMGLSMKPFLLLGRRGVFDGTVENMHLHWKYRELVKIIVKRKSFAQIKHIAISLEAESGGLLISVDKTTKGFAIIIYRGKNYQRPHALRPQNLLTRKQALMRSIELQRREALNHHISRLRQRIGNLKSELNQMEAVQETGDESLYLRLDGAYSSDDDMEHNSRPQTARFLAHRRS
uniref:CRM domain-containing protein n=1 Tax=Nelumbo nucifera TaxID=4432 RepID=A0A822ZSX0_NELNU|nr:TPA_asm: hypothetical protein HUJ06_018941 [Nelumbo nucifera]